eukprot:gene8068-6605_t
MTGGHAAGQARSAGNHAAADRAVITRVADPRQVVAADARHTHAAAAAAASGDDMASNAVVAHAAFNPLHVWRILGGHAAHMLPGVKGGHAA